MNAAQVAAALVTRGNVPGFVSDVASKLPFPEVVVYDNGAGTLTRRTLYGYVDETVTVGKQPDLSVYGRYAAVRSATTRTVYVQDDDCYLPRDSIAALLAAYEPGHVVCNMPAPFREHYTDSALVGFGAVFDRDLPEEAFVDFHSAASQGVIPTPDSDWFERCCDVVFTTLTPRILVDVPYWNFDFATGPDRMYRQPEHVGDRARMLDLARKVRDPE